MRDRRMQHARSAEAAGWVVALFVAGCAWLWVVIETTPGPFGLGRGPFVVFYPRTSGYFRQARDGLEDWPQFLRSYEGELGQGEDLHLHLGTHPPGLAMGYGGTVRVYLGGVEQLPGWSVDVTTGIVTFTTAPAAGVEITADFELDVPVRFDTDHMAVTIENFRLHRWQQIPIVELRS